MTYNQYKNKYGAKYYNLDIFIYNYYDINFASHVSTDMFDFCKRLDIQSYKVAHFDYHDISRHYL